MRKLLFLLCLSFSASAQIGAKVQQQGKIFGIWQNNQFGYQMTLMLQADGSGEFDGDPIKFSTQATIISITSGTETTKYNYILQGNSLTLSGGDLEGKVLFSRNGAGDQNSSSALSSKATQTFTNTDRSLIGTWAGNNEVLLFKADGTCVYLGNSFSYKVSQGFIIITSAQGDARFGYSIAGSQLTLTANGQKVIYAKSGSAETSANNDKGKGGVAPELVGQWCYLNMNQNSQTSRCIVLREDGTYTYSYEGSRSVNTEAISGGTSSQNSDRGTWYVQGDRLYYNSQSAGQGSYRLEKKNHPKNVNDPMIVLDGEPFVTMTSRAPWR
ncbi:MAG: hypothetical protein HOP08_07410 [Cyclobacteriaceae bacterium]|nr:hypothetical protein [Cyclobacteriaceae bacterium]